MGFYDCRCMLTGVSLKGADAALVLLQRAAGPYAPLALALKGNYNRLGAIDGIEEDANTRLILQFFLDGLRTGAFRVEADWLAGHGFPIRTVEDLLQGFERNMNDHPDYAILHGQPVEFALIARAVWDTVARATPPLGESAPAVFQRLFGASPVAGEIYAGSLGEVPDHFHELAAVDAFMRDRGLSWRPTKAGDQDYAEEMRGYLGEARRAFADSDTVTAALRYYEEEVGDLLDDE